MAELQFNNYLRSFVEIERIHDMRRVRKNKAYQIIYQVEFKDSDEYEWVDASIVKRDYPSKLCDFYETCITWE